MTAMFRTLPTASPQYRPGRRATPTGCIVLHTAETTPDFAPPDRAAENVAEFIRTRQTPGSYHSLVDSDTIIRLVEFRDEAFHDGTGSNRWSIGLSVATFAAAWATAPQRWVDDTIEMLAAAAADANDWLKANGHPACPARRISRVESEAGMPGFISHGDRDPKRRSDPGPDFPWAHFLAAYAALITTDTDQETFMLKEFIADAYVQARGYNPFRTGRDEAGAFYWLRTAAAEAPDNAWTWADCRDSYQLGVMVSLLEAE